MGRHVIYQRIFRVVQRTLLLIVPILVIRSVHQDIMVMAVLVVSVQAVLQVICILMQHLHKVLLDNHQLIQHRLQGVILSLGHIMIKKEPSVLLLVVITNKNPRMGIF